MGGTGIYHQMGSKHLQRYADEFVFRFNRRADQMQSVFSDAVLKVSESTQFPYKELIA